MQAVQSADAQSSAMFSCQANASFKCIFRKIGLDPETIQKIGFHGLYDRLGFSGRHLALKNMLVNSVRPLRPMQRCKPDQWPRLQPPLRLCRMAVRHVERNQETGVGVDFQNRPRSSITRSAPGRVRAPNTFFRRKAKSGHSSGWAATASGTIRAMTRSRSRNSTVFPDSSHALRRRVSLSWRILTVGMKYCDT